MDKLTIELRLDIAEDFLSTNPHYHFDAEMYIRSLVVEALREYTKEPIDDPVQD